MTFIPALTITEEKKPHKSISTKSLDFPPLMAAGWIKSLQCKSRVVEDVFQPHPKQLLTSTSCRNSYQNLKDVVDNSKPKPRPKPNPKPKPKSVKPEPFSPCVKRSESVKIPPETGLSNRVKRSVSAPMKKADPFFPSLTELQVGHPSRNVVEIIFHTRWGPKGFSGRVEMVFKIQNLARTVARFEEYRDLIKSRAGPDCGSGRCVADGNEMMRFHCLGPTTVVDGCDGLGDFNGGKSAATSICTYSGSGAAHESAGGGFGRRAMVVCRVIAGRVSKRVGHGSDTVGGSGELVDFDSANGENGELLVFDPRAVLPCFLVIYKL